MRNILIFILVFKCFLFSQSQIFLQITKNLFEKADVSLIFKIEKNDYSKILIETLPQDIEYSGYFNVKGFEITENIEKAKKGVSTPLIIAGEKENGKLNLKVERNVEKEILFENNYNLNIEPRYLSHIICDDIVEKLTDKPGIAKSKILFVSDRTGKKQIYIVDYDGFNLKQLTDVEYLVCYPKYFENNEILFVSYEDGWPKISKMDINSKKIETFFSYPGLNACVCPNRRTKELAIVLSYSGNPEIYIANFKGEIKKRLTNYRGVNSSPSFSPDGKYIAFVSDRGGKPQIYIMDRDGYGARRISFISNYCTSPSFSPDGNFIAYIYSEGSGYGLAIYDLKTEKTKTISNLNCEEISWAPDSRHIVFSKTGKNQPLMIIDIFTREMRKLISGNFNCISPDWFSFEKEVK